jgi:MFS family permease
LLSYRSAWGTFLGHFCGNYFFYFLLTWIPVYLVEERGLSIGQMSKLTAFIFLAVAVTTIAAGSVADRLIARGIPATVVRKSVAVGGLSIASFIAAVGLIPALKSAVVFLLIACIGYGAYASTHWAISQTLAGPLMAGRWTSIQNGVGNLSGIAGPLLAGSLVQNTGSSKWAFVASAGIALAGALIWGMLVGRIEPVAWSATPLSGTSYRRDD